MPCVSLAPLPPSVAIWWTVGIGVGGTSAAAGFCWYGESRGTRWRPIVGSAVALARAWGRCVEAAILIRVHLRSSAAKNSCLRVGEAPACQAGSEEISAEDERR